MDTTGSTLRSFGYEELYDLGAGGFSAVKMAFSKKYQKTVAIKVMHHILSPDNFTDKLLPRELAILRRVQHPHIIQVYEIIETDNGQVFVVMEEAKMDLRQRIRIDICVRAYTAKVWFSQLLSAVEYLHQNDIIHRDLKSENVLLTVDDEVKLSDFGLGRVFKGFPDSCKTFYCTADTAAPEVLSYKPYDGKKSDVWSLGVILYQMVTGTLPFKGKSWSRILHAQKLPLMFPLKRPVKDECKNFISYILNCNPSTRPSVTEVANHPWMQSSSQECITNEAEGSLEKDSPGKGLLTSSSEMNFVRDGTENSWFDDAVDTDQEDGTSSSDHLFDCSDLLQDKKVSQLSSSSIDGEMLLSETDVDFIRAYVSPSPEVAKEEKHHACVGCSPLCAAFERAGAQIRRPSQTVLSRMKKFFTVKSTAPNSSSASQQGDAPLEDAITEEQPTVHQKIKRLWFRMFKIQI